MKIVSTMILVILVLLALASGAAKVSMMEQDVQFFGKYGFSSAILVLFGIAQLLGGLLMIFAKSRFAGAAIVAATFLVSLVLLFMDGNVPMGIITGVATLLLFLVMKLSWPITKQAK